MPTELGQPYETSWRGNPPQMLESDVPIWHGYLNKHAHEFTRFYYNVRVGGPDISTLTSDPILAKCWYYATAKRIDAIGEKESELWIIEVASSPYLRAVGQCLSYLFLWNEDPKIHKPPRVVLVCPRFDSDLRRILESYRVTVIEQDPLY